MEQDMIYLDNAATSFPKPECVCRAMERCMREYCANPGRGGHALSIRAGMAVTDAREKICGLFNIQDPLRLSFTKNATEALNIAIKGAVFPGCHVITTAMEHNSVMRPLRTLERDMGLELTILEGNALGEVEPDAFKKAIKKNTVLIVASLSSNVNGIIMPADEIGRIARNSGILFLLDASQGAGSMPVDVKVQNIDLLAFPGHKGLLGPQGTGCLYVREGVRMKTLMEGGTGSNSEYPFQPEIMPDLLESGTLNTPGIVGAGAGAEYVAGWGVEAIGVYKHHLVKMLQDGLEGIPGICLYSVSDKARNSGIVAINLNDLDSTELSYILDKQYGICTRAGLHCAPGAHRRLGTEMRGVVRFSVGCFNTEEDIRYTVRAVEEISKR
jgi:cysteine desulfurase family protein